MDRKSEAVLDRLAGRTPEDKIKLQRRRACLWYKAYSSEADWLDKGYGFACSGLSGQQKAMILRHMDSLINNMHGYSRRFIAEAGAEIVEQIIKERGWR